MTERKYDNITAFRRKHGRGETTAGIYDIETCPTELDRVAIILNCAGNLTHTRGIDGSVR
jgi:hypothetical protein